MLRPLLVRRIQQRPLGARRQLAEARGEKGAQGHGARAFSPPPLLLREFFLLRGVHWVVSRRFNLLARVRRTHSGLAVRRRVPPREKCKGGCELELTVRRPPPPAGLQKGALAWAHYVKTAFPHPPRIPTGSFGGPERWMDARGLLGRLRWRLRRRRPWRGRELLGAFAAHLLAFTGNLLGSAPRVYADHTNVC